MRPVNDDAGDERCKRSAEITAEILDAGKRRHHMTGCRDRRERPARTAREIDEVHRGAEVHHRERQVGCERSRHGEERRADEADADRPLAASHGRHAMCHQTVGHEAARQHAERAEQIRDGNEPRQLETDNSIRFAER